jgi:hypothetical protein
MMDESPEGGYSDTQIADLSELKNPYGVEMTKARPLGVIFSLISGLLFFGVLSSFTSGVSVFQILLVPLAFILFGASIKFTMTERESGRFKIFVQKMGEGLEDYQSEQSTGPTKSICRECREEISPDVKRCPHCGWKPKKRGGLWWGTTALMSFNPIGWALGAKGASDNWKASKGVAEETTVSSGESRSEDPQGAETPTEKLERMNKLRKEGAISEEEFEAKKEELLKQI